MGPEILGPMLGQLGAVVGAILLLFLAYRSALARARPFALPTLLASLIAAACCTAMSYQGGIAAFLFFFAPAAIVFGLHAHAIKWLTSAH